MSNPLSPNFCGHTLNNTQPIPDAAANPCSAGFGPHRITSNDGGTTGWLDSGHELPEGGGVSKMLGDSRITTVSEADCKQKLNPSHSLPLPTSEILSVPANTASVTCCEGEGQSLQPAQTAAENIRGTGSDATASGPESEATGLDHKGCDLRHTDACWNDTRWIELNQKRFDEADQKVRSRLHSYLPFETVTRLDQKYQLESGFYLPVIRDDREETSHSRIKITRCSDGQVLVDLIRHGLNPVHNFFQCKNQDWVLTGKSVSSTLLVNLSTGIHYPQRGDHFTLLNFCWGQAIPSPDGNALAVNGQFPGYRNVALQFFDFSNPGEGFRMLKSERYFYPLLAEYTVPTWDLSRDNETVITFNAEEEEYVETDDLRKRRAFTVYSVTLRRAGDRMVEERKEQVKKSFL
ncbi:hypothetical protein ACTL6P_00920 [Endozoicomonas acroporae]|uniref:hypothetical protein n=1 Tax=Endozoicomonas acroporae TaxID=1701104 RepID=UPI000C7741E5|nr:hypothetical protein [Endozoicomonas acroporae]